MASVPTFSSVAYALLVGTAENKQLMQRVFAQLANGNGQPFMDALANDARWTVIGSSPWSRTYESKLAITQELMRPLFHQFADRYRARAIRIIAEDDVVVVEARGEVTTKSGRPYNQTYCYVFQVADGKVRQLTEYLDTDLVNRVLEKPASG
jgi:ketosteroid isomerase-like protein